MSLPKVPPGENPFTVYLDALHKATYYDPPAAFRGRMVALATCCACGMLVSVIYGLILVPQYSSNSWSSFMKRRRRQQPNAADAAVEPPAPLSAFRAPPAPPQKPKFWIARRVDGYMTMNLHFLVPFGGFISCAGMLVYTYTSYVVMWQGRMLGSYNTHRSFLWIPIVVHGYLVTAASFQAWIVVASKTARMTRGTSYLRSPLSPNGQPRTIWQRCTRLPRATLPGPRLFNSLFYGCTAVLTLSMLVADVAFAVSWTRVWKTITTLQSKLTEWESTWPEQQDFTVLLTLQRLYADITEAVSDNVPYKNAVIIGLIICAFIVALLNIGSISLLLLLRKQIRAAVRRRSRTHDLFPLPPPPLTFNRDKPASPIMAQPPTINVTFPSRPRPAAAKRLSFGLLDEKYSSPAESEKSSPLDPNQLNNSTTSPQGVSVPGLGSRRFSLGATLPSLPRLPRKGSNFTVKTAWTSTTNASTALSPNAKTPSTGLMYSPASPSMAIDLGGRSSLSDLKRAERDLEICVVIVVSMGLMFAAENVWNFVVVLKRPVSWAANELSFFFVPWVYSITYTVGASYLITNAVLASRRLNIDRRRSCGGVGGGGGFAGGEEAAAGGGEIGIDTFVGGIINEADDEMVEEDVPRGFAPFGIHEESQTPLDGMGIDGVEFRETLPVSRLPAMDEEMSEVHYFALRSDALVESSGASQDAGYRTANEDEQDALELTLTDSDGSSYRGSDWPKA
ncbi:hypothetical protein ACM66B_003211 [Microbotryomycetes sp. NB124-2]